MDALAKVSEEKFKLTQINCQLQRTNKRLKHRLDKLEVVLTAALYTFEKLSVSEDEGIRHVARAGLSLAKGILEES